MTQEYILNLIRLERDRQDRLVAQGKLPFNCADPTVAGAEKARIVGEEYGEVCEASYEIDYGGNKTGLPFPVEHLITELVQLAATAVAWAESLRPGEERPKVRGMESMLAAQTLLKGNSIENAPPFLVGQLKQRLENFNRQKNEWRKE